MKERKRLRFNGLMILLIPPVMAVVILLCGTFSMMTLQYPWEITSEWVCEEPDFTLSYMCSSHGLITDEALIYQGEVLPVWICFGKDDFTVYPKYSNDYADRFLTGTWKIRSGSLILKIDEDFIFGGQYQELIFRQNKS